MTTANEICGSALLMIGVAPVGQAADAADAALALDTLNNIMHGFKARGADLSHTTLAAADTFPLAAEYEGAMIDLLADRVAPNFGTMHPHQTDVRRARQQIMNAYHVQAEQTVDPGLAQMPSQLWATTGYR